MADGWIIVPNWDRFQHYPNRQPIWIKVYCELLDDANFTSLTPQERSLLLGIWLTYAKGRRNIPLDTRWLSRQCHQRVFKRQLESLNHAGFIRFSASNPLASRAPARSREEEKSVLETTNVRRRARARAQGGPVENHDDGDEDDARMNYLERLRDLPR